MDNFLSLGLNNPTQLVRALSLVGLSSTLLHPKKVRGDLPTPVLAGFPGGEAFEKSLSDRWWDWKGWMGKPDLRQKGSKCLGDLLPCTGLGVPECRSWREL